MGSVPVANTLSWWFRCRIINDVPVPRKIKPRTILSG